MEIRIECINKDHSHSWVRISHGLNELVTELSNMEHDDNEQETSEIQVEECSVKSNVLAFASRPKQNQKDDFLPAHHQELHLLGKDLGPMLNQENIQSPIMKCRRS